MLVRKFFVEMGDWLYYKVLENELFSCKTVLDVGCGDSSPLKKIKKKFHSVGIDIFAPSINKSKSVQIHDSYKKGNILKIDTYFKTKSFDAVIALDVVEHFKKKEGIDLILKMERIAKKKVIIVTPLGFVKQTSIDGNRFQEHKSGWNTHDFTKRKYKVKGLRGAKFIRTGEYATIVYKPWIFWGILASISQYPLYFFPKLSYQLLAIKNIKN